MYVLIKEWVLTCLHTSSLTKKCLRRSFFYENAFLCTLLTYEAMGTRVRVSLRVRVSDRVRAGLRVRIRVIAQSQVGNTLGTTVRGRVRVRVRVSIRRARSRRRLNIPK